MTKLIIDELFEDNSDCWIEEEDQSDFEGYGETIEYNFPIQADLRVEETDTELVLIKNEDTIGQKFFRMAC
jgi:hypothetical protein